MGVQQQIGFAPMPAVAAILSRYDRDQLAAFVTVAIDLMDVADGDADAEIEDPAGETVPMIDDPEVPPTEDDEDPDLEETGAEDSFMEHRADGPGCALSDPGGNGSPCGDEDLEPDDDAQGDISWTEWHTRSRTKTDAFGSEALRAHGWSQTVHEDDEDSDPLEANGDEADGNGAEDEECAYFALMGTGPGCEVNGDRELNGDEGDYSLDGS